MSKNTNPNDLQATTIERIWKSLCLAVATVYYFRLSACHRESGLNAVDLREEFVTSFDRFVANYPEICQEIDLYRFKDIFEQAIRCLFERMHKPQGTVSTQIIMENSFACYACIMAGIPIALAGPSGVGKRLAVKIVISNINRMRALLPGPSQARILHLIECLNSDAIDKQSFDKHILALSTSEDLILCVEESHTHSNFKLMTHQCLTDLTGYQRITNRIILSRSMEKSCVIADALHCYHDRP